MVPGIEAFKIKIGNQEYFYSQASVPINNIVSVTMVRDRYGLNIFLKNAGLPVPNARVISSSHIKRGLSQLNALKFPLVAKPVVNSGDGIHVVCNIQKSKSAHQYLNKYVQQFEHILFEEYDNSHKSYQAMMLDKKILGMIECIPASIVGDGQHTIEELIKNENIRRAALPPSAQLQHIVLNEETLDILNQEKLTFDSVIPEGDNLPLRYASNTYLGGTFKAIDLDDVHPSHLNILEETVDLLDLHFASVNILCKDISMSIEESECAVVSVNPNPDLVINEFNVNGKSIILSDEVVKYHWQRERFNRIKNIFNPILTVGVIVGIGTVLAAVLRLIH